MSRTGEGKARALDFARRLVSRRTELGLSQAELARRARELITTGTKLDRTSMSRYEAGENIPRGDILLALARALDVEPQHLLPPAPANPVSVGPNVLSLEDGTARLTIDRVMPMETALKIMRLLSTGSKPENDDTAK